MGTGNNPIVPNSSGIGPSRRPNKRLSMSDKLEIAKLYGQGVPKKHIAQRLGIDADTVTKYTKPSLVSERTDISPHTVESILASVGLTKERIAKNYADLVQANETKLVTFEGSITDERVVADNVTRLQANRDVAKMLDLFPSESNQQVTQLIVKLPAHKTMDDWNREHAITTSVVDSPSGPEPTST